MRFFRLLLFFIRLYLSLSRVLRYILMVNWNFLLICVERKHIFVGQMPNMLNIYHITAVFILYIWPIYICRRLLTFALTFYAQFN